MLHIHKIEYCLIFSTLKVDEDKKHNKQTFFYAWTISISRSDYDAGILQFIGTI